MGNLRIAIVRKGILLNVNVILRLQEIELVSCNCNIFSLWVSIMYTLIRSSIRVSSVSATFYC